ncbi:MAG TPA: hypothetical protein VF937_13395, partial [Chloroflexota bacterium]
MPIIDRSPDGPRPLSLSVPGPGRSGPPLFAVAAFWAFVLGGFAFGALFVVNWRVLGARVADLRQAGQSPLVTMGAGPVSMSVPVGIGGQANPSTGSGRPTGPAAPAQNNVGSIVRSVLPDWQGTDPIN